MSWFCKHKWVIFSKDVLPSVMEQMIALGLTTKHGSAQNFKKKLIVILACENCGKLSKTVEENP